MIDIAARWLHKIVHLFGNKGLALRYSKKTKTAKLDAQLKLLTTKDILVVLYNLGGNVQTR